MRAPATTATVCFDEHGEMIGTRPRATLSSAAEVMQDPAASVSVVERPSRLEVRFSRDGVSPAALTGLIIWLNDRHSKPLAIMTREDAIQVDMLTDRTRALAYLSDLIDQRRAAPRFSRCEAVLARTSFATVWRAAQEVCRASDIPDEARLRILDQLFNGVFCLNVFDPDSRQCKVAALGAAIEGFDPEFVAGGAGQTYRAMADRAYGNWVADTFDGYFEQDHALTECVDVTVDFPRRRGRVCYTRLVVPYQRGHQRYLLVATDAVQTPHRPVSH